MKTVRILFVMTAYMVLVLLFVLALLYQQQVRVSIQTQVQLKQLQAVYARDKLTLTRRVDVYKRRFSRFVSTDTDTCVAETLLVLETLRKTTRTLQQMQALAVAGYRLEAALPFSDVSTLRLYSRYQREASMLLQVFNDVSQSYETVLLYCTRTVRKGVPA